MGIQVENHHHYPITTITLPTQNVTTPEEISNFSTVVHNDDEDRSSVFGIPFKKYSTSKLDARDRTAQAAVPVSSKPPLSYRDVAARSDQIGGSDGSSLSQAKKLQAHSESENRSGFSKKGEVVSTNSSKAWRMKADRKTKCEQSVEFQKIMRKKFILKKDKTELSESTSLPIVSHSAAVDAPSKYEVLQKLTSRASKGTVKTENILVAKREREPMRAAIVSERSRSSSVFPGNGTETEIDVAAHPKRSVEVMEKKKQASIATSNGSQPQHRRRASRRRNENWWLDKTGED
ncbi:unnamed protein product [Strongylus vulgaris]|uniref:Uncharacterized protein n=1 Tax=Strongylus vulgaris TaxID=40348 RepID=A0A3P7K2A4_STRVU|nr:unnamed protein product [Strongylus vulgaris]